MDLYIAISNPIDTLNTITNYSKKGKAKLKKKKINNRKWNNKVN